MIRCFNYVGLLLLGMAFLLFLPPAGAQAASAEQVDASVKKAIEFLYQKQENGNWETLQAPKPDGGHDSIEGGQWGGVTGITTYALLAAEQNPRDPRIQKAVDFLSAAKMRGTYAIAARAQIWPYMTTLKNCRDLAQRDLDLLIKGARTKGKGRGMWSYYVDEPNGESADHSASQFALLGVWACVESGATAPDQFWKLQDSLWRQHEMDSGAWAYAYQDSGAWGKPYETMAAAGVASLYITQEKLGIGQASCKPTPNDQNIDRGLNYIAQHLPQDFAAPPEGTWVGGVGPRPTYLLYGVSRLGLASGRRYLGETDWFTVGSDYLIKAQKQDGSWGNTWETALGLLFLTRGGAPIAFNKLEYASAAAPTMAAWNVRPRDLANVTAWMSHQTERRINWQVVNFKTDPADWMDAPILLISGSDELKFGEKDLEKLRKYVEAGGMIVGNSDCSNAKFNASFYKLGQQLFPQFEFGELPDQHVIYTKEQYRRAKWKTKFRVQAMTNGARILMLFCPDADMGKSYQTQALKQKLEHFELAANLYQYMVGTEMRHRGNSIVVKPDAAIKAVKTMKVARLQYKGVWDPEPGAWRRLAAIVHNKDKIDLTIDPVDFATAKLDGFPLAHLTGTQQFELNDAQKAALVAYVNNGGTLLVDAAGGNIEFAGKLEQQIATLFGQPLETLPSDAPFYQLGGKPLNCVYRYYATNFMSDTSAPHLKSIKIKNRLAVIFSAEDLTVGLVGQGMDGIIGYAPETAVEIVRRAVLMTSAGQ